MVVELEENTFEENIARFIARHPNHPNLIFSYFSFNDSYSIFSLYTIKPANSEAKKHQLLEAINQINLKTILSTFCVGDAFDSITCATWYPNYYSRKEFSNFLEYFEMEITSKLRLDILEDFVL